MKAIALDGKQAVTPSRKLNGRVSPALIIKRLIQSFNEGFELDGEKKTSLSLKVTLCA